MKVAFIHDWLDTYRGGEKVLECLLELFPSAPIYTMFYSPEALPSTITSRRIITPRWCKPFQRVRKALLPFYPWIVEAFDLSEFDLLISSSSCAAKGVLPGKEARHLCYIHSPMRYVWDQQHHYFRGFLQLPIIRHIANWQAAQLRRWDVKSASSFRVHRFVANSHFVQDRVKTFYGRESSVVHPPIEDRFFESPLAAEKENYFLAAGAFVSYKRFDLAIEACKKAGKRLIIAGSGPEESNLRRLITSDMKLISRPSDEEMRGLLANAQALVFPGVEDFGMIPIEAMALGTPVIALAQGGALDYTIPEITGMLVGSESPDDWARVITNFDRQKFEPTKLRKFASQYSKAAFQEKMRAEINMVLRG